MPQLQAILSEALDFGKNISGSLLSGKQEQGEENECAFLDSLVELVEADFAPFLIPKLIVSVGVDSVNQHSQDQFPVNFAFQPANTLRMGSVDGEDGFELLKEQFNLPTQ